MTNYVSTMKLRYFPVHKTGTLLCIDLKLRLKNDLGKIQDTKVVHKLLSLSSKIPPISL